MKKKGTKYNFLKALFGFITFSIVIIAVTFYFVYDKVWIGPVFIGLGVLNLIIIKVFGVNLKEVYPDMVFGLIDNGGLVFAAALGGLIAGIPGAIIGGAAGNTITDGIAGLFEGQVAESQRKYKIDNFRTAFSSSFGKMAGCLFGAGIGLVILSFI
tara:strand:+ start:230 stop:697 length:468 start_codon:yes stop_codon:yes gene_type:complete